VRVVFIGASGFGLSCLDLALSLDCCEVAGVVTAPRQFSISYRPQGVVNILHADFNDFCRKAEVPCVEMEDSMKDDRLFNCACSWKPDVFLVVGWYHLVPRSWRGVAPAYGLHASLLPDYSGGAPLVWAMINGERQTGITLFQLDDGVDSGPIVGQAVTAIQEGDTIASLYERIEILGRDLLGNHLPKLASGEAELRKQDEKQRRIFPQRGPEDGLIDWNKNCGELVNFIRAQTKPYPGAYTTWKGHKLQIWGATMVASPTNTQSAPGEILNVPDKLLVQIGSGALQISEVTYRDQDMSGVEFLQISGQSILGN